MLGEACQPMVAADPTVAGESWRPPMAPREATATPREPEPAATATAVATTVPSVADTAPSRAATAMVPVLLLAMASAVVTASRPAMATAPGLAATVVAARWEGVFVVPGVYLLLIPVPWSLTS